ncbi:phospholipase C-gamma-1 [Capsaspora owczarzaki ATCC 30864]|uniref:Phosphoinositide phospholipase C n=1 Tax=Capsaspora owczarzaki (strain ATCC 30864) TaxID=595528 RepID=A0A0D2WK99_CAPO3|nr:phospholipase C-gamma-1 [Capsaspora owczarzaki ATCC 30864]KJE90620.1 phospholipase C-gamma-1 [Capsaspora owczarzaki ATCC 30864]|eukprot:XP_004364772.2 phospholipase C-gamma-1 [Capsaspora owczarzaki ATCC 30864]
MATWDAVDQISPLVDTDSLKRGTPVLVFTPKQKPSKKIISLDLNPMQLQILTQGRPVPEQQIDIFFVREVRQGKQTKEFDRFYDDYRGREETSFVIYYGMEFRLKTIACVAESVRDRDLWCMSLPLLVREARIFTELHMLKRWLIKEWQAMNPENQRVGVKELTTFFARANLKVKKERIKELIQQVDTHRQGTIGFDEFTELHRALLANPVIEKLFAKYSDGKTMTQAKFTDFLRDEQGDLRASDPHYVKSLMLHVVTQEKKKIGGLADPVFHLPSFATFMLSKHNNVYNDTHLNNVYQNMTLPLSHYWIASSHNTYLTGDQFSSESTCDAYARCLRNGCRCIELDCWDGPDNDPIIYHGHTMTSKIKFRDVVETIKQHAFETSPYPVILSIENHCCIEQQQVLATVFKDVFGDMLLTQVLDKNAEQLPSPDQLKYKILIKNKKLKEGAEEEVVSSNQDDLSQSQKNGYLTLEDPLDGETVQYYFVLAGSTLHYGETTTDTAETQEAEVQETEPAKPQYFELHNGEPWFHGKLKDGRVDSEARLAAFNGPDGSFLIRESDTAGFTLSFWLGKKAQHVRIKENNGHFFLTEHASFTTLYELVDHYRQNTLKSAQISLRLTEHVPLPSNYENKEWYHKVLSRIDAENMLKRCRKDGSFLVRRSETSADSFAISFLAASKIKHCRIKTEGRFFVIGSTTFDSLEELVGYYEKHPLYRRIKLKFPVNEKILEKLGLSAPVEQTRVFARTLFEYNASRPDELTFTKDAIISNIERHDGGWWKGEYNGKVGWLPSNYVEEIDLDVKELLSDRENPLGALQKGSIDLVGATVRPTGALGIQITTATGQTYNLMTIDQADLQDWQMFISAALANAGVRQDNIKKMVRKQKVAKELSDIVAYCRSIPFESFEASREKTKYYEMSSFEEKKADKIIRKQAADFVHYNRRQFSRTYPAGKRVDSSNFDPEICWIAGMQLVALNYQTPDRPMQVNEGLFLQNKRCGFVVKPDLLVNHDRFSEFDETTYAHILPKHVQIQIFSAKHLVKSGKGTASPFVEIDICGAEVDSSQKHRTKTKPDNGFNPVWNESCEFFVRLPDVCLLRIAVMDEDMFGDPSFMGQAVIPFNSLRPGYRAVPLRNGHSEEFELASVFIHITINDIIPQAIEGLQDMVNELQEERQMIEQALQREQIMLDAMQNMARADQKKAAQAKISKALKESEKKTETMRAQIVRIEQELAKLAAQASNDPNANAKGFARKSVRSSIRNARNNASRLSMTK